MHLLTLLGGLAVASIASALPDASPLLFQSQQSSPDGLFEPSEHWHLGAPAQSAKPAVDGRSKAGMPLMPNPALDLLSLLAFAPPPPSAQNQPVAPPVYDSKEEYRVNKLPGLKLQRGHNVYAGHMPVDKHNSTEFFIYHSFDEGKSKKNDDDDDDDNNDDDGGDKIGPEDVVVWLNGGPGASSMFGLFVENGPWQFSKLGQIRENDQGWQGAGNVLFLENPAGVGFSYVKDEEHYVKTIHDVADQFWHFVQEFMVRFPETKNYRWWITGESFGGMYVPHIAHRVLENNDKLKDGKTAQREGDVHVNLSGVAIGNGAFYSPFDIPVNWFDYMDHQGYVRNAKLKKEMKELRDKCSEQLADKERFAHRDLPDCLALTEKFTDRQYILRFSEGSHCMPTFYDVRVTKCSESDPTDYYQLFLYLFLNNPQTQRALHAAPEGKTTSWYWLDQTVYKNLYWNGDQPSFEVLPGLAERIPVMIYNGDKDIICNYIGNEATLDNMEWNGRKGFEQEEFTPFKVQGKEHGLYKKERGLTYVRIYEAGHMVPFNQPEASLEMLKRFMNDKF
ncbi:hypothetical protein RI367_007964 [Sorochytrium milnesiophthora]